MCFISSSTRYVTHIVCLFHLMMVLKTRYITRALFTSLCTSPDNIRALSRHFGQLNSGLRRDDFWAT